jgi:hypothetical protein
MITVATLKELLSRVPDDATLNAYEGTGCAVDADIGIVIRAQDPRRMWWIRASESDEEETFTTGFD